MTLDSRGGLVAPSADQAQADRRLSGAVDALAVRQVVAPFDDDSACAFRGEQRLTPEQAMDWAAWIVAQEGPPAPWR